MTDEPPPERPELPEQAYGELRAIAQRLMRNQGRPDTMQATALLHEAWLRLLSSPPKEAIKDRVAMLAHTMRNVLVDRARARNAARRGGGRRPVTLDSRVIGGDGRQLEVLAVHEALEQLQRSDAELSRLAELRIFAGLQESEIATTMGISLRTVERRWRLARAWLQRALATPCP